MKMSGQKQGMNGHFSDSSLFFYHSTLIFDHSFLFFLFHFFYATMRSGSKGGCYMQSFSYFISEHLALSLCKKGVIDTKYRNAYTYCFEFIFSNLFFICVILLAGIFFTTPVWLKHLQTTIPAVSKRKCAAPAVYIVFCSASPSFSAGSCNFHSFPL